MDHDLQTSFAEFVHPQAFASDQSHLNHDLIMKRLAAEVLQHPHSNIRSTGF